MGVDITGAGIEDIDVVGVLMPLAEGVSEVESPTRGVVAIIVDGTVVEVDDIVGVNKDGIESEVERDDTVLGAESVDKVDGLLVVEASKVVIVEGKE